MFNSKYPIVAVGMNKVSDIHLALAVSEAGGIATVSGFNYLIPVNRIDTEQLTNDFDFYQSQRKSCDFIFSIDDQMLIGQNCLLDILIQYKIKYIELITTPEFVKNNYGVFKYRIQKLKEQNIKILLKMITIPMDENSEWRRYINKTFDAIIIKGRDGAGRVLENSNLSLLDLTEICIKKFPGKHIIPCGGIGDASDVKQLIDAGASAVGIGTLFAASSESPLSEEAKEKIVSSGINEIQKLSTNDLKQNALIFTEIDQDKENNTKGLIIGIKSGSEGHIFIGKGVGNINSIKSTKDIMSELTIFL